MKRIIPALAILMILTATRSFAATPTAIEVSGTGTVTLTPDMATVHATVTTNAASAAAAVSANNERYNQAVEAITHTGVARTDITLSYYNVNYNPKPRNAPPDDNTQYGYTVTRSFDVKVRAMSKAGAVVDASTGVEDITIGGVDFGVADTANAQREAAERAVTDARDHARSLAAAAGLHIVGIKRISQGGGPRIVAPMMMRAMAAPAAPTTFDSGGVNVSADVTIVYLAEP